LKDNLVRLGLLIIPLQIPSRKNVNRSYPFGYIIWLIVSLPYRPFSYHHKKKKRRAINRLRSLADTIIHTLKCMKIQDLRNCVFPQVHFLHDRPRLFQTKNRETLLLEKLAQKCIILRDETQYHHISVRIYMRRIKSEREFIIFFTRASLPNEYRNIVRSLTEQKRKTIKLVQVRKQCCTRNIANNPTTDQN
jgi:hypothetical protein